MPATQFAVWYFTDFMVTYIVALIPSSRVVYFFFHECSEKDVFSFFFHESQKIFLSKSEDHYVKKETKIYLNT
jgi:hypothetical protein